MTWLLTGVLLISITWTLTDAECHCDTETACSLFPSTPCSQVGSPDRCQQGWFGSYCQKQNIALGRSANQSSTYTDPQNQFEAKYAVDGRATTNFGTLPLTCTHTLAGVQTWTVYLDTPNTYQIQRIRLYLRDGFLERNRGMKIFVDEQLCAQWPNDYPPAIAEIRCQHALIGDTLTIQTSDTVTLCEVQIFVCSDGWFDEDCDKRCHCSQNTEVCDEITGQCLSGCAPGYMGRNCQTVCPDGRYGVNCPSQCGHCLGTAVCDKVTGKCPRGCQPGWWPDVCSQACSDGRYGHHCQSEGGQCKGNLPCNKINGICEQGCQPGFQKPSCKECVDGMYGDDCMSQCGRCKDALICDKSSGECPEGCQGYFMKPLCQECPATPGCLSREAPVVATLGTLLVLAVIALLTSIFYIRRLKSQLATSQKKHEDNYISLDENTKDPDMETTYQDIDSTAPCANTEEDQQVRI